jgi:cellulose synthase/poly-beta-1,6-N-acetylglucosamine synthase-like glycosyltransferase
MSYLDTTSLLFELDWASALALFWYVLLIDLPRYTLGFCAAAVSALVRKPPQRPREHFRPLVTIVLAGHNERAAVRRCVQSLREQTYDRLEIICVDDGSIDGMGRELRRMREERLIDAALATSLRSGKSSASNLGISLAHGEIIVVADCDCTFDRDAIRHLITPFEDPAIGAVCANIGVRNARATLLSATQGVEYLLSISLGKRLLDMFGQVTCASGAFSAFRRRALAEVAGHDVGPGEDLDLTLRLRGAGWKIGFAENAWCLTDVPETLDAFIRQRLRWERDSFRLRLRKYRRSVDPRYGWAGIGELLHQLEYIFIYVVGTFAFAAYLIWLSFWLGAAALTVLALVALMYLLLDLFAIACVLVMVDRAEVKRLFPYVFIYGPFHAYLVRTLRLVAYVQEWMFVASRRDWYVPARIADKAPFY